MDRDEGRLKVIQNIKEAVKRGALNSKVEINDHIVTEDEREEKIIHFDNQRNSPIRQFKKAIARNIANSYTKIFNVDTEIEGIENIKNIKGGAIITSNHFSPQDSTIIRHFTNKIGKRNHLDIIIEEENIFMEGQLGFLMNNCSTLPISKSKEYMSKNLMPAIGKLLSKKDFILIYPEEQMWFNYRKVRPLKIGAYHIASKFNVPVIPCFIEIRDKKEYDSNGFKKLKYILHIMPPIYPELGKDIKENKSEMCKKDYKLKVDMYEKCYGKKMNYEFDDTDIAGF